MQTAIKTTMQEREAARNRRCSSDCFAYLSLSARSLLLGNLACESAWLGHGWIHMVRWHEGLTRIGQNKLEF